MNISQEINQDAKIMWSQPLTRQQETLRRSLLADIPDAEIEAYGTEQQIKDAFGEQIREEDKQISEEFIEETLRELYEIGFNNFYWDVGAFQYIIVF